MVKALSISRAGVPFDGVVREGVIYRLRTAPSAAVDYPYLVVSENVGEPADILMIRDFNKVKKQLKKTIRKGTGLELTVNPARKMDGGSVGRWFSSLTDLHAFCHSSRCQFILSSGATSQYEMISGRCLDAILKTVGIEPQAYWRNVGKWLEERLLRNVSYAKEKI
jgi:RNase P/RNase MRP subunit p30